MTDVRAVLGTKQSVRRTRPPLKLGLVFEGAALLPGVRSQDCAGGILAKEPWTRKSLSLIDLPHLPQPSVPAGCEQIRTQRPQWDKQPTLRSPKILML